MEIFEVRLSAASEDKLSELTRCLTEAFANLHISGRLESVPDIGVITYRCSQMPTDTEQLAIKRCAAEGMAEYVLSKVEPELIRIIVRKHYPCEHENEADRIAAMCRRLLGADPAAADADAASAAGQAAAQPAAVARHASRGAASTFSAAYSRSGSGKEDPGASRGRSGLRERRKRLIAAELLDYLQERASVHLEGYITFRLDKYWEELTEAAEAAVDEFVVDRQYREFVGLLNEFVSLQEPRLPGIHLVLTAAGEFVICDEAFRPMTADDLEDMAAELPNVELNVEDMIVSSLLALSPQSITLHVRDPEQPVVQTIEAIFDERLTVCIGCPSCRPLTGAVPN